jgi:putative redox protein
MTTHLVTTTFKGGMAFEAQQEDQIVRMDSAVEVGGTNSGFRPKQLLLASLAGCTGMDVESLLVKMRVEHTDFTMQIEGDLLDEHPKQYTEIRLTYSIKVSAEEHEKVEKAITLSQDRYCGVSAMLKKVCPVIWNINYL